VVRYREVDASVYAGRSHFPDGLDALLTLPVPLLRQVSRIEDASATELALRPDQLFALSHAFPQLQSLWIRLVDPCNDKQLLFPSRLQRLDLDVGCSLDDASGAAMMAAIGQLQQLHTLSLHLRGIEASLMPLQHLSLLRDLELGASFSNVERFSAELRALFWLHRLRIYVPLNIEVDQSALFHALLRDPSEQDLRVLQWREFALLDLTLTDEMTPLLLRLSSLQRMETGLASCTRFEFLAALPQLTDLELYLWRMELAPWTNLLAVFTSDGLTRLRTLGLWGTPCCNEDDLTKLLSHTPTLTRLTLNDLKLVSSLSFFRQLPKLGDTLLTLECSNLDAHGKDADLPALHGLQQLRQLRLRNWSGGVANGLTPEECAPFERRPCVVLPRLEMFEWTNLSS
jgi:hypothetical protein